MGTNNEEFEEELLVTLTMDDDTEIETVSLGVFTVEGQDYIALQPITGPDAETGEVYFYKYAEENGEPDIKDIESDDEYEKVCDFFDEMLDGMEFDELVTEEDTTTEE